jgi:hypothetical protein
MIGPTTGSTVSHEPGRNSKVRTVIDIDIDIDTDSDTDDVLRPFD